VDKSELVSSMALRLVIDTFNDILGEKGKNSVLNYAGFGELIKDPPAYDETVMVPRAFLNGMIRASVDVVGAGNNTIRHLVAHNPNIRALAENTDIPALKKLEAVLNYYSATANRPPLFVIGETMATYRVPSCVLCEGMRTEKPFCTYIAGVFEGFARHIAGIPGAKCVETLCKARGDSECTYEITYDPV
jgi:predicted hydrocarbon binding protein